MTFDAEGRKTSERIAQPPVPGLNVITTIDRDLQWFVQKVLAQQVEDYRADSGAAVVMATIAAAHANHKVRSGHGQSQPNNGRARSAR